MNNSKIKVAVLGIGNCASSLVQGLEYYKINDTENGLISDVIGGYRVSDIEIVAAFDINKNKVGKISLMQYSLSQIIQLSFQKYLV